ncbi:MAG: hypothetical protein H6971_01740 [Gammaproteobacteria bacterium]|nr:hypothetical protein [Gammaproteobacteria bacterium]
MKTKKQIILAALLGLSLSLLSHQAVALVITSNLEVLRIPAVDYNFKTVGLQNTYASPVITCTYRLPSAAANEAAVRINNVTGNSFNIKIQRPNNSSAVTASDVYCLAAEAGLHSLPDGRTFEAHTALSTTTSGNNVWNNGIDVSSQVTGTYSSPVVLGQVMSYNDTNFSVFWSYDCESRSNIPFQSGQADGICIGKHIGQINGTRANETLGYIIVQAGAGSFNGITYQTALGANSIHGVGDSPPYSYNLNNSYDFGVATKEAEDGGNGGWAELYGVAPFATNQIDLAIDEETVAGDMTRTHVAEQVAYWGFFGTDYGDAPSNFGNASHRITGLLSLGTLASGDADSESGPQYSTAADGDDNSLLDDEDGVTAFPTASTSDGTYTVDVAYTNNTGANATLCGWINFDQGASFDNDERACATVGVSGTTNLAFTVPVADRANSGQFYARFRIASNAAQTQSPTGSAADGEVEDYRVNITTLPVTLASVDSHVTKAGLRVDWTTATETRNVGFHLYGRRQGEMAWRPLTEQLIPSSVIDSLEPQRYSAAVSGDADELLIEGWDSHGQTERHGPFTVGQSYGFDAVSRAQPIDWAAIAAENAGTSKSLARTRRMSSATTGQADALLWVTEPGIQRISFAALQAAGADFSLAPVAQLALTDDGQGAPRYVLDANANGLFDDGDSLEFVGTIADTLYSGRNAYRLRLDPSQVKAVKNVPLLKARNAAPEVFPDRLVFERQKAYSFTSPIDPWYDQWLTAYGRSASLSRSFALPGYAGGDATLHLTLWGVTDWPGVGDDHHLRVKVNEQTLADFSFDGNRDASRDFTVPEGALTASGNTLTLEAPGDTGFAYDIQAFDGFTVAYARQTQAQDGAWRGTIPTNVTSPVQVSGFQGETVAWKGAQRRVGDGSVILKGAGAWQAADGRALQTPIVQAAIPQPAQTPERGAVDYLIVSHPQFLDTPALTQLAALQESRGYSTAVLDVQSLYAAYSDFAVDPEAIRAYLRQARPAFVLLVGGDSYDYRDYLGLASQSFIPTFYAATDSLVTQAPADNRFVDYNDNGIPQAAIGRLPVRTVAELTAVADKLVHYQPPTRAVLAAGPSDGGRQFAQVSEEQAQPLLNRFVTQTFYVDDEGLPNAQAALLQALDQDGALVSYVGHSSFRIWGLNPSHGILLWADDARRLTNPTPHLVTQWGCWNTYFVDPNQDTLANGFLLQDHGAAGVLGATALTDLNLLRDFGTEFFRQYAQQPTLGEALRAAQRRYITGNPKAASALRGFVLLGDPATELQ